MGLRKRWVDNPRWDAFAALAGGAAFAVYVKAWPHAEVDLVGLSSTLAGVAGTVLGMFAVVYSLLRSDGGKRMKTVMAANPGTVNANWRSILVMPGFSLLASLVVMMVGPISLLLSSVLLGLSAAGVALSGLRMGWFVSTMFQLNAQDERPREVAQLRDDL